MSRETTLLIELNFWLWRRHPQCFTPSWLFPKSLTSAKPTHQHLSWIPGKKKMHWTATSEGTFNSVAAGLAETHLRLTWLQMDNQGATISFCSAWATHHMPHALSRAQFHHSGAWRTWSALWCQCHAIGRLDGEVTARYLNSLLLSVCEAEACLVWMACP